MRLADMSFTDYLMAECDYRERQRKERVKHEDFKRYCTENNYVPLTTEMYSQAIKAMDALEQIRQEIAEYKDNKDIHAERNEMIDICLEIIDKYKGE